MSVPNGTPGSETPGPMDSVLVAPIAVPEGSPEAVAFAGEGNDAAATDGSADVQSAAETTTDDGQALSDDTHSTGDDGGQMGDGDASADGTEVSADDAADAADLAQYPERLRDRFKSLSRDERREMYEYAESRVKETYEADRERTARLEREREESEAQVKEVRSKAGRFIGLEPSDNAPSYDDLAKLLTSRDGDDVLEDKYGLSRYEALDLKEKWDERREMLRASAGHFAEQAWNDMGAQLETSLKAIDGLNADEIVTGAKGIGDVVSRLHASLTSRHEREVASLKKGYEDRIKVLGVNSESLKGLAAAGSHRRLETDGRTGGGSGQPMSLDEYRRLTPEQQAKLPSAVIDDMTRRLTAPRR